MLSTSQPKRLRFALTAPKSAARLQFSPFRRAVSQHELNLATVSEADRGLDDIKDMEKIND